MRLSFLLTLALVGLCPLVAKAKSSVVPLWAENPDIAEDIAAQDRFARALRFRGLKAPIKVTIERSPAPRTPELYRKALEISSFDTPEIALKAFTAATTEVLANGGAGLSREELVDLFFRQAVAIQRASVTPNSATNPNHTSSEAKQAYLRAAVFGMVRTPPSHDAEPLIRENVERAVAEVNARPRADLSIHTRPAATVFIDGQAYSYPAKARNLAYGEHLIRVEEKGYGPWSLVAIVSEPNFELDPPRTLALQFPPTEAARLARSQGGAFALLGQVRLEGAPEIDLSLVEATTGKIQASASVSAGGEEAPLTLAVLRLDEEASRVMLEARPPEKKTFPLNASLPPAQNRMPPPFREDPAGWSRAHWPLLTAIGTAVGSAILLGILVAKENDSSARP